MKAKKQALMDEFVAEINRRKLRYEIPSPQSGHVQVWTEQGERFDVWPTTCRWRSPSGAFFDGMKQFWNNF